MDIYVQSRGVSKGYCWLNKNKTKTSDLPDNFKRMLEMVDSDYFSMLIYRANGQLSLLVTALESQNRIDNRTRKICNSLLWVGNNSDEKTLRALSIQALNGELEANVDPFVASENNDQGFTVEFDLLKPENLVNSENLGDQTDGSHKVGNLSALRDSLIGDLEKYALPKRDGMLVVVSRTVSQSSLEREKVWRGLSDSIPDDEWIDILSDDSKKLREENKGDDFRSQPSLLSSNTPTTAKSVSSISENNTGKNNGNNKGVVQPKPGLTIGQKVLSILLAISLFINIGLFLKWQEAIKNKKEYDKLLEKSKVLKKEIESQEQEIKTKNQEIAQQKSNLERGGEILNKIIEFTKKFDTEGRKLLEESNNFIKGIQK